MLKFLLAVHPRIAVCCVQGTDQSYLDKQHQELSSHPHYIKSADKRRWGVEFGVRHYAGPVMYQVAQILEKNKDVQQDILFDAMDKSTVPFVRELTKYRVSHMSILSPNTCTANMVEAHATALNTIGLLSTHIQ